MKLCALIGSSNQVVGVVQIESYEQIQELGRVYGQIIDVTDYSPLPQIGWSFDGQSVVGTSASKKITKLAMNQRFTVTEMLGLLTYVGANPASIVALLLQRLQIATFVDLSRSDTQAGVGVLVSYGLLTQQRATEILTGPVTVLEAYTA